MTATKPNLLSVFFYSFLYFTVPANAYTQVPDNQVLNPLFASPQHTIQSDIRLLVWNTHKGADKNRWGNDLKALSVGKTFILLQEGMNDDFMPEVLGSITSLGWLMAQNFYMKAQQEATGVITGHQQEPTSSFFQRTIDSEPITNTPKVSLFTTYLMEKGSRLLVINIHGINFTSLPPFFRQIDEVISLVKKWDGKVIFAGDFNTWAKARTDYLRKKTLEVGLTEVSFTPDPRKLVLDHIFVRGCQAIHSQVLSDITTSDHAPLAVDLVCPEK